MASLWLNDDGDVLMDDAGNLLLCDDCPCDADHLCRCSLDFADVTIPRGEFINNGCFSCADLNDATFVLDSFDCSASPFNYACCWRYQQTAFCSNADPEPTSMLIITLSATDNGDGTCTFKVEIEITAHVTGPIQQANYHSVHTYESSPIGSPFPATISLPWVASTSSNTPACFSAETSLELALHD